MTLSDIQLFLAFFVVATGGVLIHFVEASYNPIFERYAHSFWWAMVTMMTFGQSDINPVSSLGQVIEVVLAALGACFYIYFLLALTFWLIKKNGRTVVQG